MSVNRIDFGIAALLLCLVAMPARAEGDALDDVTMEVVEDPDADEAEYVDEIELPAAASPEARGNAAFGIDRANEARDRGNEARDRAREAGQAFGQSTAQEARELGRDAGNAAKSGGGKGGGPPEDLPVEVP